MAFRASPALVRRRLVDNGPEHAEVPDGLDELGEIDRLDHKGVDAEIITQHQVAFLARGREHDDGDVVHGGITLERAQHLEAIDARHFQVQQDDAGQPGRAVQEFAPAVHVIERLRAIAHGKDLIAQVAFLKRVESQLNVVLVVLDEQDFSNLSR